GPVVHAGGEDDALAFQQLPERGGRMPPALRAREWPGRAAGAAAEHGTGHQPRAAGVVVVEEPADELAARVEAGDRVLLAVDPLRLGTDPEPAERERDPGRNRVAQVRRGVDRLRPVRLGRGGALRALAVLHGRVERARLDGGVVLAHRSDEAVDVDLELAGEL